MRFSDFPSTGQPPVLVRWRKQYQKTSLEPSYPWTCHSQFHFSFSEVRFIKNSSEWQNLSCARLDLDATSECKWEDKGAGCSELEWDGFGGLSCNCNQSGSYALMWSREIERVSSTHIPAS